VMSCRLGRSRRSSSACQVDGPEMASQLEESVLWSSEGSRIFHGEESDDHVVAGVASSDVNKASVVYRIVGTIG
jgi:hypothetical protein